MPLVSMALAWALAAGLLLIPMAPFMTVRDYLIHLLPVHLLMLAVAVGVGREDMGLHPSRIAMRRILPFVLGATGVLLPVAILYASWGALGDLIHGMFVFPLTLQNYYLAATLPRPAFALFGLGAALAVTAGLLFTSRRRQSALGAAVAAGISLTASFAIWAQAGGWPMPPDQLWRTSALFDWILPTLLVIAAALLVLRDARSGRRDEVAGGLVALAFFQAFLCFQIFPRAGHNVWLAQGSMVPLATVLAYRAFRSSTVSAEGWRTQCAAVALCLVLPLWLAAPVVADVLGPRLDGSTGRPVGLPHTRGLVVDTDDWKKLRLGDVRALVRHLRRADAKGSPILLIGDQQMIYYVSDRPHLAPEREFLLYSAAAGMIPPGETNRLGDEIIAQRLLTTPQVRVVIPDDPSADRLLALLPAVERVIAGRYEIEARFGSYVVWSRRHDAARTDPE